MAMNAPAQVKRAEFDPKASIRALLDTLYDIKFSKHTPLVVVLLSMIYTVHRTQHYLSIKFHLDPWVSWPTAGFLELLVLAAAASVFIALRDLYIAQLKDEDAEIAQWGVYLALTVLVVAFMALLFVAWSDAWSLTEDVVSAFIMSLAQIAQAVLVFCFIIAATLDEREKLRTEYADFARQRSQDLARSCPHCHRPVTANNRTRHIASCPANPANQS